MGVNAGQRGGIKPDGSVWLWGINGGQLGDNTTSPRSSPVLVVGNHSFIKLRASCVGSAQSRALKSDGSAWGWGFNGDGEIGDNTKTNRSSPVLVVGDHSFVDIGSGSIGVGLKGDGSVWCWGKGAYGQLGNNTASSVSSPVLVVGDHSFIKIPISGGDSTFGLKVDGSAWGWGSNGGGVLGDGTRDHRSSPVLVIGNHSFIKLSINPNTAIGLKTDGAAWTWANNSYGQLGTNNRVSYSSPVLVVGDHSFIDVGAAQSNCIALKSDGSVWTWGSNTYGQLGDNTIIDRSSPVLVVGDHSFVAIWPTDLGVLALKSDGSTWSWGENGDGEVGDNTIFSRSSPVLVVGNHHFATLSDLSPITLKYRTGNSVPNCKAAGWNLYMDPFTSEGFVQIKAEVA